MFWLVKFFLRNFSAHYACLKLSLESKKTFGINESNTRDVEIIAQQLRAIFIDFKKLILRRSQESISVVKKSFFETSTRLVFWLVKFFLRILWTHHAYVKCSLESKKSFGMNESNTRRIEMIMRQLRAIIIDFKKWILRRSQEYRSALNCTNFKIGVRSQLKIFSRVRVVFTSLKVR